MKIDNIKDNIKTCRIIDIMGQVSVFILLVITVRVFPHSVEVSEAFLISSSLLGFQIITCKMIALKLKDKLEEIEKKNKEVNMK